MQLPGLNPRRSLVAGLIWLVVGLAGMFSIAVTLWVGSIARESVIAQHMRRLSLETDQLSSAVTQAFAERLSAVRVTESLLRSTAARPREQELGAVFAELQSAYPQLDWIAISDAHEARNGWRQGLEGPWIGVLDDAVPSAAAAPADKSALGGMAAPVHDAAGQVIGVVSARLSWRRTEHHPQRLTDEADALGSAKAYILNRDGVVLVGPGDLLGKKWPGMRTGRTRNVGNDPNAGPHLERLPGGDVLVVRETVSLAPEYPASSWVVQLSEPRNRAYQRADTLALHILWASCVLAALIALLGIIGARTLTHRLRRLANSVTAAGETGSGEIDVPAGSDEVARLGAAFARTLAELQQERRELERRILVRTREVERLAEDARYAAIVRERLKIARDLHDTLAHSMMAILSEIRYLRRLQVREPHSIARELQRAEQIAHEGLKEARSAITQMRGSTVRDTGLGEALAREVERFANRTGIATTVSIDPAAAGFADDRAETILRMAQEAIRNVEGHSMATSLVLQLSVVDEERLHLEIADNGVGFDPRVEKSGHYGLLGLQEQAALIGAMLQIDSAPERGTVLRVEVPLAPVSFKTQPAFV